jgi:hypothetical protein
MWYSSKLKTTGYTEAEQKLLRLIPHKRMSVTSDIGNIAVFLCSDLSD